MNEVCSIIQNRLVFSENSQVNIGFDTSWFAGNPDEYNHELARFCSVYTMLGYYMPNKGEPEAPCALRNALAQIGMKDIYAFSCTDRDEVDYAFANRKITVDSGELTLVYCITVGSYREQWYTNFDCGTDSVHKGFLKARDFIYLKLTEYLDRINADKATTKLLFSGHSRGGAAAGLLASKIKSEEEIAFCNNVYAFTFAVPYCVIKKDCTYCDSGIFNIINDEDFVTRCMPRKWGYERLGRDIILPNRKNCPNYDSLLEAVKAYYRDFNNQSKEYYPYKKSTGTVEKLFEKMVAREKSTDEYYNKKLRFMKEKITLFEFFNRTVCGVVGTAAGTKENNDATMLLVKTFLKRVSCDRLFVSVADFFIIYEGLAGVTKNKISKNYFSLAHDVSAYCAYMMASDEAALIMG